MAIKTNMKSLVPRREAYKREIILLSKGFTNRTAWPGGKMVVFPWDSGTDEFLVEASRKSSRNDLVYGLLERLCDLNGAKLEEFVASELNTVLLVARAAQSGGAIEYQSECPYCHTKHRERIVVPDELEKVAEKPDDYPGYDTIVLPDCGDVVKVRPLLVKDERIINERQDEARKQVSDRVLHVLMPVISINDTVADTLTEMMLWYNALSPRDAKFLERQEDALTPHLETSIPHICDRSECAKPFTHALSFDQEFFR